LGCVFLCVCGGGGLRPPLPGHTPYPHDTATPAICTNALTTARPSARSSRRCSSVCASPRGRRSLPSTSSNGSCVPPPRLPSRTRPTRLHGCTNLTGSGLDLERSSICRYLWGGGEGQTVYIYKYSISFELYFACGVLMYRAPKVKSQMTSTTAMQFAKLTARSKS
jgi:hypothetical protein